MNRPDVEAALARHWKLLTIGVIASLALTFATVVATSPPGPDRVDMTAPNFVVFDTEGGRHELEAHRGDVVLLDLMATWCSVCNATEPEIRRVYENYSARGLVVLSISIDPVYDTDERLRGYAAYHGSEWPFARDVNGVKEKYKVHGLPTLVLVDKAGDIAFTQVGFTTYEELAPEVERIL